VLIGCVDRASARQAIMNTFLGAPGRDMLWLDCGNTRAYGQVLLGTDSKRREKAFDLPGFCAWLPLPCVQSPDLLDDPIEGPATPAASCAEMALVDSQGLAVNQRIAAEASDYLVRALVTRDLRRYVTYLDLASGSSKSTYITIENVQPYMEQPKKRKSAKGEK